MSLTDWTFDPAPTNGPLVPGHYREFTAPGQNTNFTGTDADAHIQYRVLWDERLDFVSDLLGYADFNVSVGSGVTRVLPQKHPELPLYAMNASYVGIEPSTVVEGKSAWTEARIDAIFRPVDYLVVPDDDEAINELYRFVTRRVLPKADYLQLATNAFTWTIAGGNLGAIPGIITPNRTLEYTWHMVPSKTSLTDPSAVLRCPIEDNILQTLGTTNVDTFDSVYPAGTVLFIAAEAAPIPRRFNDKYHWEIKYYFEAKDHGFIPATSERAGVNYIYNPTLPGWDKPVVRDTGKFLYEALTTNGLFQIL